MVRLPLNRSPRAGAVLLSTRPLTSRIRIPPATSSRRSISACLRCLAQASPEPEAVAVADERVRDVAHQAPHEVDAEPPDRASPQRGAHVRRRYGERVEG